MNKENIHNIKLGLFVVTGALLLVIGLYFIGNNRNMFGNTLTIFATFQNVSGLQPGNNVRYAGIDIGTVEQIEIINDTTIRVEMSVKEELKNVIRKNSIASIGTDGLMGNKLINIDPGTKDAALVSHGDELRSIHTLDTEEMLRTLNVTNQNVAVISANLKNITSNINESRGTLYAVLMDTSLSGELYHTINNIETTSDNLSSITDELSLLVHDINRGKGLVGTLLKDTVMTYDLKQAITDIRKSGEQINSSAGELKLTLQKINNGDGTLSTLLNDTLMANHLKRSIINIENSTENFNENMEALKHSFLLKGYFKKQPQTKKSEP